MGIRASVIGGRLVVDQPTDLPEGTVLDLVVEDEGDDLRPDELDRLQDALSRSHSQASEARDGAAILEELRSRR